MKKKIGLAVIGAALLSPFMAHAEGAYVGFNAGRAQQKLNIDQDIDNDHYSLKDSAVGYKLYGGYDFNRYFGIQGGYVNMGKAKASYGFTGVDGELTSKVNSLYIAAVASLPVNDQFSIFGKLGISRNRVKVEDNWVASGVSGRETESETRTAPLIGIGAEYKFTKNLAAVVEYESFGKVAKWDDAQLKANMFSVGLHYHF